MRGFRVCLVAVLGCFVGVFAWFLSTCVDVLGRVGVRVRVVLGGVGSSFSCGWVCLDVFPRVIID